MDIVALVALPCLLEFTDLHNVTSSGVCIDEVNGWKCDCPAGWVGKECHINFNECHSHPCHNGAVCVDEVDGFR